MAKMKGLIEMLNENRLTTSKGRIEADSQKVILSYLLVYSHKLV